MVDMTVTQPVAERSLSRQAWFMVGAALLGTMCCSTSVILVNVGVFMKPLGETFGWARGDIALSLSIAALSMAAANPFVGGLIDRFGVKPVLVTSLLLYGLFVAATPLMIGEGDIWGLYLAYAAIAGFGAGSNVIAYVRLLSGWFTGPLNDKRGLALGISSAGIPLGTTITSPLGVLLIDAFGWQGGFWGLALLPLVVGLPIALFLIRPAPGEVRRPRGGGPVAAANLPGLTMGEAMRTQAFWLLLAMALLMSSCLQAIGIHTAPLLGDFGMAAWLLALILAIDGALGIVARVGAGFLFDRFFAPYVSAVIFSIAAVSAFGYAAEPTLIVAILATLLITIGSGAESDFIGYVVGRYFGLKSYGQIFGAVYGMFMIGIALGPYLFGVAFDAWGNYQMPFLFAGIGVTVICILMLMLPAFPAEAEKR
ncbi:MAG: MFS transporter [Alphaproteobacteria bacterium]|nr:MFS transporter [Alphaproteobacteria bacterium]